MRRNLAGDTVGAARRSWSRALLVLVTLAIAPCAQAPARPALDHLDFERDTLGRVPAGWIARRALRNGYRVETTDFRPHGGRACASIARDSVGNTAIDWNLYGALAKRIDARPFRGRRVKVAGWLRYEGPPGLLYYGSAGFYINVDRVGGRDGFSDDMMDRTVQSSEWTRRELFGEIDVDADSIVFGAVLHRAGHAWFDDLSFTDIGPGGEGDEPARALSEDGVQNLVAFARLLGYVRHFHPSDESAATDWDRFAIAGVDEVEGAHTSADLAAKLRRLFHPIAPTLRLDAKPLPKLQISALRPAGSSATQLRGWWHHGWGGGQPRTIYYDRRVSVPVGSPGDSIAPIGSEVNVELGRSVWCSMPITLYADTGGTLPRGIRSALAPRRPEGWIPSDNDRATRLADVILFWNIAQNFYPYFDVARTDWAAELPAALRRAATDPNGRAFEPTLQRLVAALHDGHGNVVSPYFDAWGAPIAWSFVEGRLVVVRSDSSIAGRVQPGDEVVAIDGRPIADAVKEAEGRVSAATPQFARSRLAGMLRTIDGRDSVAVDLRSRSGASLHEVFRRSPRRWVRFARPDSVSELRPGILYLDLDRITDADFQRALPRLEHAKGIVFDLRGYPGRLSTVVLSHLTDSTITSARWNVPVVTRPDHREMAFDFSNWVVTPVPPRLRARAAFVINGSAISYAETYLGIVENYRLAELVGEPTAGTNGDILIQRLPGGYDVSFTGMKVLKHDGSRHHGVGILPTVPASPTIAGVRAGRDEQLEKAIEVVSR